MGKELVDFPTEQIVTCCSAWGANPRFEAPQKCLSAPHTLHAPKTARDFGPRLRQPQMEVRVVIEIMWLGRSIPSFMAPYMAPYFSWRIWWKMHTTGCHRTAPNSSWDLGCFFGLNSSVIHPSNLAVHCWQDESSDIIFCCGITGMIPELST